VLGAIVVYQAGSFFNAERLEKWLDSRAGRMLRLKRSDIRRANGWFSRYGYKAVFLCRCVPLVRSLISLPAGMARMRYLPFLVLTAAGSLIWNTTLIWFGAAAGESWGAVTKYTDVYSAATIGVLGLTALILGAVFIKKRFLSKKNIPELQEDNVYPTETR
jgi:membrane protein DedA with SNARE-associated domain